MSADSPVRALLATAGLYAGVMLIIAWLFLMYGCVRHDIRAPQIDQALTAMQAKPCPTLNLPPIPQDVVIDIKGDQVTANAGGEQLLRGYVSARSLLRGAP